MVSDQKYLFDCEYTRRLGGPRAGSCGPRTLRHEEISIKIFSNSCSRSTFTLYTARVVGSQTTATEATYFSEYLVISCVCDACLLTVVSEFEVISRQN